MAEVGDHDAMVERTHETEWRHLRIGALQDLSRARTDMEQASGSGTADPEMLVRLEEIERELAELRRPTNTRSQKRNERQVLDLLLSERLLLNELGFASYADYETWLAGAASAKEAEQADPAYVEFARMQLDAAQERLEAIDAGELPRAAGLTRPSDPGELQPYLIVPERPVATPMVEPADPHAVPLEVWTAQPSTGADADADAEGEREDGAALPHLGTTDLDGLDLPYWDETA